MTTKKQAAERLAIIAAEIRLALDEGDEDCPSWADDLLTVADALHPSGFVDETGTGIDTRYSGPTCLRRRLQQMIEAEDASPEERAGSAQISPEERPAAKWQELGC